MNSLVYLIAFVAVAVNVGAQNANMFSVDLTVMLEYHKDCKAESGVSDSVAIGSLSGKFPEDANFKQYMLCMSKKLGFQNDAGILQKDVLRERINAALKDPNRTEELIEKCAVEDGDPSEMAFHMGMCLYKEFHTVA